MALSRSPPSLRGRRVADDRLGMWGFEGQLERLSLLVAARAAAVEKIQGLLNAQNKPGELEKDRGTLSREFEDCISGTSGAKALHTAQHRLLREAQWASGFRPRD